jgi:beta-aspartyl-peptidase (threonine type)
MTHSIGTVRRPLCGLLGALAFLVVAVMTLAAAAPPPAGDPVKAIKQVLQAQTDAWNRGDLEGYMAGYWKSEDLTFYSGGTVTRGWQATLERYRTRYQGEGRAMGALDFPDEVVDLLGADAAVARGHYHLKMPDGKELQGLYTVILKRLPDGWRIVHDHSSSE